jgi:hypothetical protein
MTFEQFLDLIELERLYLTNITIWDDCYEGYEIEKFQEYNLSDTKNKLSKESLEKLKLWNEVKKKLYYAQSWTKLIDESDAMWRIYSPQKTGVRIKVKKDNIISAILELIDSEKDIYLDPCSGDIEYEKPIDYEAFRLTDSEPKETSIKAYNISEMPLIYSKRKAFIHEEEYRFSIKLNLSKIVAQVCEKVTDDGGGAENMKNLYNYDYPKVIHYKMENDLISEVLLDPRAPKYFEEAFIEYCNKRKFTDKNIVYKKSDLYTKE